MSGVPRRILIVDDESPVREVLSEYFTTHGYAVETASSGPEALSQVERQAPDLVLLDIRMPGMDGVEVLKRLRRHDPSLAVVMVTANDDLGIARETLKIGAFDYVSKPFDFRYLDRTVAAGLSRRDRAPVPGGEAAAEAGPGDAEPWRPLALAVFRAVRGVSAAARASTGERLETAALAACREALTGQVRAAAAHLAEIDLLLAVATELGDLGDGAADAIAAAVREARAALPAT